MTIRCGATTSRDRVPSGPWPVLALVVALAGCGATGTTPTPVSTNPPRTTGSESGPEAPPLPRGLVGLWTSSGGDAAISFYFEADGSYAHSGFLVRPGSDEQDFTFVRQEVGRAVVRGSRLSLRPDEATTHSNPDENGRGLGSLMAKEFTWQVSQDELLLSSDDGGVVRMLRQ